MPDPSRSLQSPDLRQSLVVCLEALGELDAAVDPGRIVAYDNITFELETWLDDGDASWMIGETLYDGGEARALNGLRAAFDLLYDVLGRPAPNERAVRHPGFLAVVCAAAYAAETLRRNDA